MSPLTCTGAHGRHQNRRLQPLELVDFLLEEHARSHVTEMTGASEPMTEDQLLDELTAAQLRLRPFPVQISIAWLLWRLARSEDVTINMPVADRRQVLAHDRLGTQTSRSDSRMAPATSGCRCVRKLTFNLR